ncbi:MAG: beta-glucosidase [Cytophagaceae bacterium]
MKYFLPKILIAVLLFTACSTKNKPDSAHSETERIEFQVDSILSLLTLQEKVAMIHASSSFTSGGVPRLGIPEWVMSDGPHGVRKEHGRGWKPIEGYEDSATYLPTGIGLAATWNTDLGYAFGKVLGAEANYRGKDVILGPGVNILRTPLNGRNFEYLSEDPYLTSRMAIGYIKGVQDQGVAACVKHFLANNQEFERHKVDVQMSERALREIYLPAFEAAVKEANVLTVMGAYNKFRGQYCTHHKYLINKILKEEMGFQGVVISDWGAVSSTMEALEDGCDLEMGSEFRLSSADNPDYSKFYMGDTLISLVKMNPAYESLIDDKVRRILRVMIKTNVLHKENRPKGAFNTKDHQATALKVAEESITLLKNDNILPLDEQKIKSIAVIGANAIRKHAGAGGSSQVNAKYEITPLAGIENYLKEQSTEVKFAPGYSITKEQKVYKSLLEEAVQTARSAEKVIFVGGWIHGWSDDWDDNAYDAESLDKTDIQLPFGQKELINALLEVNPNTILVFMGGGSIDMSGFEKKSKAIIYTWYPGMEGGNALANILFGATNPSGKLPVTFPKTLEDVPAHKLGDYPGNDDLTLNYNDDIWVGYRYYDTKKVEPLFPFGHGLSYTTFNFNSLKVNKKGETVTATISITNTGKRAGAEVVQLYVSDVESSVERPKKELKGFHKVFLNPGESKEIQINLNMDAFKFFDEQKNKWVMETGEFVIQVGNSSRNLQLEETIRL